MSEDGLLHNPDLRARMRATLPSQFHTPKMLAFVDGLARGAQEIEDLTFSLIVSRTLAAAAGAQLDQWGKLVGEERVGLGDTDYRRFIEARILVNLCESETDEIIAIWAKVAGPGWVRHRFIYPAGHQLEVNRRTAMTLPILRRVRRMMVDVRPIGQTMYRVESLVGGFGLGPSYTGLDAGGLARSF